MVTEFQHSTLHFDKIGHGQRNLLFFHGFGQDRSVFGTLGKALRQNYTVYVFDLYFHGTSLWRLGERPLEKTFWKDVLANFLREQQIETFSVAGFSLGGKFALATLEAMPSRVEALMLIAPDGIATNAWYSLATYPLALRKIFKSMVLHPNRFHALVNGLRRFGLVDKGLLRFAEYQMDTETKRRRVYLTWIVFRRLAFSMRALAQTINFYHIPLLVVTGRHDKVIRTRNMHKLLKHVKNHRLTELDTGHRLLRAEGLAALFNSLPAKNPEKPA